MARSSRKRRRRQANGSGRKSTAATGPAQGPAQGPEQGPTTQDHSDVYSAQPFLQGSQAMSGVPAPLIPSNGLAQNQGRYWANCAFTPSLGPNWDTGNIQNWNMPNLMSQTSPYLSMSPYNCSMPLNGMPPQDQNTFNGVISAMLAASLTPSLAQDAPRFPLPPSTPARKQEMPTPRRSRSPRQSPSRSGRRAHSRSRSKDERSSPKRASPSKASGGVPCPTPEYLMRASFLPRREPNPRPILVVIDLNGTLLYRPDRKKPFHFTARPHAETFLSYCIDTFWVVIWSSARPENVNKMCESLLEPEQLSRTVAVWGRDKFGLTAEDYHKRVQCYKRLTKLWGDPEIAASHPRRGDGGSWGQGNTVLIDDSAEKARSEPHNAIQIPEFTGDIEEHPDILPQVHDYLNELSHQADISTYIRANPFKAGNGWPIQQG